MAAYDCKRRGRYSAFPGEKTEERVVGLPLNGGGRHSDLDAIAIRTYNLILGGSGLKVHL